MNAAVFLDRDNTLILNDGDLGDPDQVKLIQGAASAVASLRGLGYKVVVVTNQGGVARGKYTEEDVERVHRRINELVKANSGVTIDRFYYCPYHPEALVEKYRGEHPWRKPQAGMLLQAAKDLDIDLARSWMVGDKLRDVEAGVAAGVKSILLKEDAEELTPLRLEQIAVAQAIRGDLTPHFEARNVVEAVRLIAQQRRPETPEEAKTRERIQRKWEAGAPAARPGQDLEATVKPTATAQPARPSRPFRPWDAPPVDPPGAQSQSVAAPPAGNTPVSAQDPPPAATQSPAAPEPQRGDEMLRHILQELRQHRAMRTDFTYSIVLALVLQLIAVVCLLGALWMGRESQEVFLRWIAVGVMVQLMTLSSLLFGRRS